MQNNLAFVVSVSQQLPAHTKKFSHSPNLGKAARRRVALCADLFGGFGDWNEARGEVLPRCDGSRGVQKYAVWVRTTPRVIAHPFRRSGGR